jgi:putative acetyltransferase
MMPLTVLVADNAPAAEDFRVLLGEYFEHLLAVWPNPAPERWQRELDGLPGAFARPSGRALVAYVDGEPAGIVALVAQDEGACEVKRLFVRPGMRRRGVSRALMAAAFTEAAEAGYVLMRLGTSSDFIGAIALYESLGFERGERFRDGWSEKVVFMARAVGAEKD